MPRNSDTPRGLTAVPDPEPTLGERMAALALTEYDELDLILRPHLNPERTRRQMDLAHRILFGEAA